MSAARVNFGGIVVIRRPAVRQLRRAAAGCRAFGTAGSPVPARWRERHTAPLEPGRD